VAEVHVLRPPHHTMLQSHRVLEPVEPNDDETVAPHRPETVAPTASREPS